MQENTCRSELPLSSCSNVIIRPTRMSAATMHGRTHLARLPKYSIKVALHIWLRYQIKRKREAQSEPSSDDSSDDDDASLSLVRGDSDSSFLRRRGRPKKRNAHVQATEKGWDDWRKSIKVRLSGKRDSGHAPFRETLFLIRCRCCFVVTVAANGKKEGHPTRRTSKNRSWQTYVPFTLPILGSTLLGVSSTHHN